MGEPVQKCPACNQPLTAKVMRKGEDCGTCVFQGIITVCNHCHWQEDESKTKYVRRP